MNNKFTVFTDGACLNNGKKNPIGAIGIFFNNDSMDNLGQIICDDSIKITNQTMELLAVIKAMQIIDNKIIDKIIKPDIIYIYTDSTYIINSITKWYPTWLSNNWMTSKNKPVENKELIQLLYELKNKYIVIFKHVRSHQKEPIDKTTDLYVQWYGNHMADHLATSACKDYLVEKNSLIIENDDVKTKPKKLNKKKITNQLNV